MEFKKYQHVERFGTDEVEGIEDGMCLVFPKIDGTNASVWLSNGEVCAESRKRELSLEDDNAGFCVFAKDNKSIKEYLTAHPAHRLYGEWLVPHRIKAYEKDAWKRFYVFDVMEEDRYLPYAEYHGELEKYGLDFIPPLAEVTNGKREDFLAVAEENTYLVTEGKGEGVVIKNYDYVNRYGRVVWAKIVLDEFKTKRPSESHKISVFSVENRIIDKFLTEAFIDKEYEKVKENHGGWNSKYIPELLNRVFHEFVTEETWHFVKENKFPVIDFGKLNKLCTEKIKVVKKDLF